MKSNDLWDWQNGSIQNVTRFYTTDPNHIRKTPPVGRASTLLKPLKASFKSHLVWKAQMVISGPGLTRISGALVDGLLQLDKRFQCSTSATKEPVQPVTSYLNFNHGNLHFELVSSF